MTWIIEKLALLLSASENLDELKCQTIQVYFNPQARG